MSYYQNINEFLNQFNRNGVICFTNGCFDLLHAGHVQYLKEARAMCDYLVVGLNSDDSIRRLKGPKRPIQNQTDRGLILSELRCVDAVILFNEDTPYDLIKAIKPDVLIKGGDYQIKNIVGYDLVPKVLTIPMLDGRSSSNVIEKILTANSVLHEEFNQDCK